MAAEASSARTRRLPTVLVLDFWDSYTANILKLVDQLSRDSASAHEDEAAGQRWDCVEWQSRVVVVNVDSLSWSVPAPRSPPPRSTDEANPRPHSLCRDSFEHDILPHVDCVILGPGPGTPHRQSDFSWPTRLLDQVGHRVPIFGLCLGCQGLATVHGGSVRPSLRPWPLPAPPRPHELTLSHSHSETGRPSSGAQARPDQLDPPHLRTLLLVRPLRRHPDLVRRRPVQQPRRRPQVAPRRARGHCVDGRCRRHRGGHGASAPQQAALGRPVPPRGASCSSAASSARVRRADLLASFPRSRSRPPTARASSATSSPRRSTSTPATPAPRTSRRTSSPSRRPTALLGHAPSCSKSRRHGCRGPSRSTSQRAGPRNSSLSGSSRGGRSLARSGLTRRGCVHSRFRLRLSPCPN